MNNFIVLYSGGMGSFLATYLLKIQNPGAKILLYFNDTKYEDPDLYRFLKETVDWLKLPLLDDSDGRSVWELFEDEKFVGNSRVDICSRVLKRDRSQFFIKKNFKPDEVKIVLGIDWTEIHRLENAKPHWEPYKLIAPLCDYKGDKKYLEKIVLAESGIKRPKLYDLGFAHNNCGGRCVKQGLAGFRLLYEKMPERYLEMETQQEETKKKFPQTKPFLKKQVNGVTYYLSLKDYREQYLLDITHQPTFDEQYDFGGCACAL